ncbi:MAG: hypothetical protein AAGE83_07740, partial [Pseudomonadota bacterium]
MKGALRDTACVERGMYGKLASKSQTQFGSIQKRDFTRFRCHFSQLAPPFPARIARREQHSRRTQQARPHLLETGDRGPGLAGHRNRIDQTLGQQPLEKRRQVVSYLNRAPKGTGEVAFGNCSFN